MVKIHSHSDTYLTHLLISTQNNFSFKPAAKPSVLKKYGASLVDFLYGVDIGLDIPWIDYYHEASYKIERDFILTLDLDNSKHVLNITRDDIFHDKEGTIRVEEMWTIWSGLCYKFTPLYKTQSNLIHYFRIHFSPSLLDEDKPKINMIFTTEKGSTGILDLDWIGKDYALELDPKEELEYDISLQPEAYARLEQTSNCSLNDPLYKCVSEK